MTTCEHKPCTHKLALKVQKWMCQLNTLSEIALTEPNAAYCCFIDGLKSTWNYSMRSAPGTMHGFLAPIEDIIRNKFIPALTRRPEISDLERQQLALPCRLGGLTIPNLTSSSPSHLQASKDICGAITKLILYQQHKLSDDAITEQK